MRRTTNKRTNNKQLPNFRAFPDFFVGPIGLFEIWRSAIISCKCQMLCNYITEKQCAVAIKYPLHPLFEISFSLSLLSTFYFPIHFLICGKAFSFDSSPSLEKSKGEFVLIYLCRSLIPNRCNISLESPCSCRLRQDGRAVSRIDELLLDGKNIPCSVGNALGMHSNMAYQE